MILQVIHRSKKDYASDFQDFMFGENKKKSKFLAKSKSNAEAVKVPSHTPPPKNNPKTPRYNLSKE